LDEKYGESVADHSFVISGLSYLLAKELGLKLDYEKVLKLSLFHEVGEIYSGDIVSFKDRDMSIEEKKEREKAALENFLSLLNAETAKELRELFNEFEKGETAEAKFVKSMDQLEATFQA
jgi:putative hydrolase of HD superfamily